MSAAPSKIKSEYILPHTTAQDIQPSPLALLAATCSKIGTSSTSSQEQQEGVQQQQGTTSQQVPQQQASQVRVVNAAVLQQLQAAEGTATILAGHQARDPLAIQSQQQQQQQQTPPQLITLQNFIPIHQSGQHHVSTATATAVASENTQQGQPQQQQQQAQAGTPVKTFVSSAAAVTPTVVSVQGVSGQFLQQQGAQLVAAGGQNLAYNVVQPMQTVTVDGQEALFIPAVPTGQHQAVQLAGQTLITPTGQILRAPGVYPTSLLQNVGGQTVQMANA